MTEFTKEQRKEEIRGLIAEAVDWQAGYEHPIHDKPQRDFFEGMELAMLELLASMDAVPQPAVVPEEKRDDDGNTTSEFDHGWNACRAAMLQGTEPVQGWIPCNERMPGSDGNYWGWWSESKRQGPVWFIKSEMQAQFQSSEITHWMPLPAAPQQEAN